MKNKRSTGRLQERPVIEAIEDSSPRFDENARFAPSRYRRAALGLVAIGVVAAAGGIVFSDVRAVLFSLAATGLFGAVFAIILGTDRLVPSAIAEHVYDSTATNEAAFVDALGLSEQRIYVPTDEGVFLYVPAGDGSSPPVEPSVPWSTNEKSELLLEPTGAGLFRNVHRTLSTDLEPGLETTAEALTEGLVEILEIAREANASVDSVEGAVTVDVSGHSFGDLDRFDHPIASYLAVGFAAALDRPITLEIHPTDGRAEWQVVCSWNRDE